MSSSLNPAVIVPQQPASATCLKLATTNPCPRGGRAVHERADRASVDRFTAGSGGPCRLRRAAVARQERARGLQAPGHLRERKPLVAFGGALNSSAVKNPLGFAPQIRSGSSAG